MKYKITISGSGGAFGCGEITEEQYDYWTNPENEEYLVDALQQDIDQDELGVPEEAKFNDYYDSYTSVGSEYGLFENSTNIRIETETAEVLYDGSLQEYDKHFDLNIFDEYIQSIGELYVPFMASEPGVFLFWEDYQRGVLIRAEFEAASFEPSKLVFFECDLNGGNPLVTGVQYDGVDLELDLSGMDSKSIEFSLHDNRSQ